MTPVLITCMLENQSRKNILLRLKLQIYFLISVGTRPPKPVQIEPFAVLRQGGAKTGWC